MSDSKLIPRFERKFAIDELNACEVEHLIRKNPSCFSEIFHPRYINNIYLDTYNLNSWHENLIGNTNRVKARIRWYDDLFGKIDSPVLEFKVKQGLLGTKPKYNLPSFIFDASITKDRLHDLFRKSDLKEELVQHMLNLEPTLLNRYKRKYFLSIDKRFRLTLDTELAYYKIRPNNNTFNREFADKDKVIIEIKYDKENDSIVDEITRSFSI